MIETENPKFALITGGAKRLGARIAKNLARSGYDILIHFNTSGVEAYDLAYNLSEEFGINARTLQADFAKHQELDDFINFVTAEIPNLSLIVNNASIFRREKFLETEVDSLRSNFRLHLETPLLLAKMLGTLKNFHNRTKIIINMLDHLRSGEKIQPYGDYFNYSFTKHCQYLAHKYLVCEFSKSKIRINALALGLVLPSSDTEDYFRIHGISPDKIAQYMQEIDEGLKKIVMGEALHGEIITIK